MKRNLLFWLFTIALFTEICHAQNSTKTEKLLNKLKTAGSDSARVHLLLQLSDETRSRDIKQALKYAEEALAISKPLNFKKGIAGAYNNLANIYDSEGDLDKATSYYKEAARMYEELNDSSGVVKPYHNLGMLFSQQGDYSGAITYYFKALKIKEALGSKNSIALRRTW